MPDTPEKTSTTTPLLGDFAETIIEKLIDPAISSKIGKITENILIEVLKNVVAIVLKIAGEGGAILVKGIAEGEDAAGDAFGELASAAVADLFGVRPSPSSLRGRGNRGARAQVANDIGDMLFRAFMGQAHAASGGGIQPSDAPAKAFLTTMTQLGLEGWLEGWVIEALSLGQMEQFGELDDIISHVLGLGRAAAAVHGPVVKDFIVTPLEWKLNKEHRATLLTASLAVRQFVRGQWSREKMVEELARQGYSDDRIEALINAQLQFFSAGDVRRFVYRGHWDKDRGLQHLKDQGYTPEGAEDAIRLEGLRRSEQLDNALGNAIVNAYVDRRISDAELTGLLQDAVLVDEERELLKVEARTRRELNIRRLSPAEARAAVRARVLSVRDYRQALEREGYPPDDVLALELVLRAEMDEAAKAEDLRRQALEERAREKAKREEERAARKAELEREREQHARGPLGPLEQAAIRGLISLERVAEVYGFDYDAETVEILMELLEDRRVAFVAQEEKRKEAEQRIKRRGLSIDEARRAVFDRIITIEEFRARLGAMNIDAGDADIITATLAADVAARDEAERKRREAESRAEKKKINITKFETLVRRGHRSLDQYAALLADLDFDEGSIAAMVELLQVHIADDEAARLERERKEEELRNRGLSIQQFRRGVLLGVKTPDDYSTFLIDNHFSVDAQIVLMAELRDDLAEAEAARARRKAAELESAARKLPLSAIRRAAQLGVISPDVYVQRLRDAKYAEEDIDIDLDLLLMEIADVQQKRAARDAAEQQVQQKGLSLAVVERAVKAGVQTLDDYRAAAYGAGYGQADVETLVDLLARELAQLEEARRRREQIAAEAGDRMLSLSQLEEAVKKDLATLDDYYAGVLALGYGADDAELLTSLVAVDLEAKAAKAA